jgi:hypothetical protein
MSDFSIDIFANWLPNIKIAVVNIMVDNTTIFKKHSNLSISSLMVDTSEVRAGLKRSVFAKQINQLIRIDALVVTKIIVSYFIGIFTMLFNPPLARTTSFWFKLLDDIFPVLESSGVSAI